MFRTSSVALAVLLVFVVSGLGRVAPVALGSAGPPPGLTSLNEPIKLERPPAPLAPQAAAATSPDAYGWDLLPLDQAREFTVGSDRALRLDSQGHPHIAYGLLHLYYATWDGAAWQLEVADTALDVGWFASLVLDDDDQPHISYHDEGNDDIKYAHWDGAHWQTQVVETGNPRQDSAIGLDSAGNPCIAYYDGDEEDLIYAYWDGAQWQKEVVDAEGKIGWCNISLVVDDEDVVHVSYCRPGYTLAYARRDGSWQVSEIEAVGGSPVDSSIVLDAAGQPHIAYEEGDADDLKHAYRDGSDWQTETVVEEYRVMGGLSLAIDGDDHLHATYRECSAWPDCVLHYVYQDSTGWQPVQVLYDDDVGGSSVSTDGDGYAHAVFGNLLYQHQDGAGWQAEPERVDEEVGFTGDISMVLDSEGEPHVSYYEKYGTDLRYAYVDEGEWYRTIYSSTSDIGLYNAIGLNTSDLARLAYYTPFRNGSLYVIFVNADGSESQKLVDGLWTDEDRGQHVSMVMEGGLPRLAYYDDSTGDLRYAEYSAGSFDSDLIDAGGDVGEYTSVTIYDGKPRISYYDHGNTNLKYAVYVGSGGNCGELGRWSCATVDSNGWIGLDTSLAVEPDGDAHIAYRENSFRVWHVFQVDGTWQSPELVGDGGSPSLVVDAAGQPHLAFAEEGTLYYTSRDAEGWRAPQQVHWSGGRSALALHDDGYPRVAFLSHEGFVWYATAREAVAPSADFSAEPTSGPAPLAVQFTNTSTGDYTDSLWTFGDGMTSTLNSPLHTYQDGGGFDVSLTVSGPAGSDAETRAGYITVQGGDGGWVDVYLPLVVRE